MSARLRQRRLRLCNRSINTPVKGVPTSSRRRPTSCFCCREFIRTVVGTLPLSTNFLIEPFCLIWLSRPFQNSIHHSRSNTYPDTSLRPLRCWLPLPSVQWQVLERSRTVSSSLDQATAISALNTCVQSGAIHSPGLYEYYWSW